MQSRYHSSSTNIFYPTRAEYLSKTIQYLVEPRTSPPSPSSDIRLHMDKSNALKRNIAFDESVPIKKVHLIGHSMGGLDCRYYIDKLGGHKNVMSLTTVGTPHRGSGIADWLQRQESVLKRLKFETLLNLVGVKTEAFEELTVNSLKKFNEAVKDHPDIHYFSLSGGARDIKWWSPFYPFYRRLCKMEGPNDGLVSVESAKWGHFLGALKADHLEQINWNWFQDNKALYRATANWLGSMEDKWVADELAKERKT